MSHTKWMSAFDVLSSGWFGERLQDFAFFETNLGTSEVDLYIKVLMGQVADFRTAIEDYQKLMVVLDEEERLRKYEEMSTNLVHEGIKEVFRKAGKNMDLSVVDGMYQKLMSEAAML